MQFGLDIDTEMKNLNEHLKQNTPSSGESDTSDTELKSTKKIKKHQKNDSTMIYLLKSHEELRNLTVDFYKDKIRHNTNKYLNHH